MSDRFSLAGKTALVFGGTAGIGLACVRSFAEAGSTQVMLVGRNPERGRQALKALQEQYPRAQFAYVSADASTAGGAELAVASCLETFGAVDILLSSAGGQPIPAIYSTIPINEISEVVNGTLLSAMLPARAVLPHMMDQQGGTIITVASDAGKVATPGETAIGTAMAGIIMFSKALANEVKRSGIRVNCLTPSIVQSTEFYDALMKDPFSSRLFSKAESLASLGVVQPQDIGDAAVFLASDASSKITGQAVSVNGGISMA